MLNDTVDEQEVKALRLRVRLSQQKPWRKLMSRMKPWVWNLLTISVIALGGTILWSVDRAEAQSVPSRVSPGPGDGPVDFTMVVLSTDGGTFKVVATSATRTPWRSHSTESASVSPFTANFVAA